MIPENNTEYIVVLVTVSNEAEAQKIASLLLEQRKAACVNIIPAVSSLFRWGEKIDKDKESLLIIKSTVAMFPDITDLVKINHSYEVAEIIALPVLGGNPEYLNWIHNEVKA